MRHLTPPNIIFDESIEAAYASSLWKARLQLYRENNSLIVFLNHVVKTVPYYAKFKSVVNIESELYSFPLVTKQEILSHYDAFLSNLFNKEDLKIKTTSGTTGVPLKIIRDLACWYSFIYDCYRQISEYIKPFISIVKPGKVGIVMINPNIERMAYSVVNPSLNYAYICRMILGRSIKEDEEIVRNLRGDHIPLLYGRPRSLLRVAEIDENQYPKNKRISPDAVLVSGDNLYYDDRKKLQSWFSCLVHNAYVTQELGFVGIECKYQKGIHVLPGYKVEVLKENGSIGETGCGELVITNVQNWAMAFIRYRTGDSGTVNRTICTCGYEGLSIINLYARDPPYFIVSGRRIDTSIFDTIFENLPVKQYQIIQTDFSVFMIRWVPESSQIDINKTEKKIAAAFYHVTGISDIKIKSHDKIGKQELKVQRYVRK